MPPHIFSLAISRREWYDENGKAIRKNVLGKTQTEAREKLKRAIGECAELDVEMAEEYTVGSWVRTWYEMNCLERVVKERLILQNPTDDCIVPKLEKKEMHILRPESISSYLKEAERQGVLAMFFLELTTGLPSLV